MHIHVQCDNVKWIFFTDGRGLRSLKTNNKQTYSWTNTIYFYFTGILEWVKWKIRFFHSYQDHRNQSRCQIQNVPSRNLPRRAVGRYSRPLEYALSYVVLQKKSGILWSSARSNPVPTSSLVVSHNDLLCLATQVHLCHCVECICNTPLDDTTWNKQFYCTHILSRIISTWAE